MENIDVNKYYDLIIDKATIYIPKIFLAIIMLWIGFKVIKKVISFLNIGLEKSGISETIRPFLGSLLGTTLKIFLIMMVAGVVGIELSFLVGILTAATFAIGMALQGSLGNFASGILVLFFKPYKIGDWIRIEDKFGKVKEIQIFNTIISTPGNKLHIIPNGKVTDGIVTNFSEKGYIRVELKVTMPYSESFPKVKKIIMDALADTPNVIQSPSPEVGIINYDSHYIELAVRPYTLPDQYWEVTFDAYAKIKEGFHKNGVKMAYSEGVEMGDIGE